MKILMCFFTLLFIKAGIAQNKIFFTANDFNTATQTGIKEIRLLWGNFGNKVLVINNDGFKIKLRKKNIWGIEKNNVVLRLNEANTLELVDTNGVVIYKTYTRHPVYYFSKNLNSKAIILSRKNVMRAFDINKFPEVYKKSLVLRQVLFYTEDFRVSVGSSNN